jgi:hypothetical protein
MTQIVILVVVLGLLAALVSLAKILLPTRDGGTREYPFVRCDALMSPAERSFYGVLVQAAAGRYAVFGKVRLGDIVKTMPGLSASSRASAFNRIACKHVDFVLCDPRSLAIMAVVELDDKSHSTDRGRRRDEYVDGVLSAAAIPLMHVRAQRTYALVEITEKLKQTLVHSRA